jgi:hypothetical protein
MKRVLFITDAKGGLGKTLIARHCQQALARLHYPPIFGEGTPRRLPRLKVKRPYRIKNSTVVLRRH